MFNQFVVAYLADLGTNGGSSLSGRPSSSGALTLNFGHKAVYEISEGRCR